MDLRSFIPNTRTEHGKTSINLEADEVYRLLGERRRRLLLDVLDDHRNEPVPLSELAREVATLEEPTLAGEISRKEYNATYVAVYQSHVPVLDEAGVVEWDGEDNVLRSRPATSALADLIRDIELRTA